MTQQLSEVEARVLAAVDADAMLAELADFVAIPSVVGTPEEAEAQRWCASRLKARGLTVDGWETPIDALRDEPDFPGMEVQRSSVVGCVGVLGATDELPALALYGHTDVVPAGDLTAWTTDGPFRMRVEVGAAWGRGTCDMKGGIIAALAAIDAVRRSGVELVHPLAVHCVSAEEDGGLGAYDTLRRGHRAAACISAEPTSGHLVPANAGALTFRLEVPGLATHGSTRTRGVSAIEKFERVHAALRELEAVRNAQAPPLFAHLDLAWPLSVGIVSSGDWASTVPDLLVAEGRYGVRVDETVAEAIADFERHVNQVCAVDPWLRDNPVRVSWPGGLFAPGALPDGHPLLGRLRAAVRDVTGESPDALGGPYGSDLRHYVAADVPTVQYGPGEARFAHAADEHVLLADLSRCARVYALMILRHCARGAASTS
ncbi:MAG: ArgE/DapE family deacylase [Nocardioidaceae bacterium]